VENINTLADHQLLYNIAQKHDGELLSPNELNKLIEKLNNRNDIKTISYSQNKLSELINLKWIFFLLLALMSLEWFIRKRNGAY
jgi:ribonuclease HIII